MPRFSIVVPIYQAQEFLGECLASIQGQTFGDFEVLCVIDGATDASESIARRFARDDERFNVFVKQNGGLSSARNYGIDRATGDIVLFVDSDDQVTPDCCERLDAAFDETGARVVVFGMEVVSDEPVSAWFERTCSPDDAVFEQFGPDLMFAEYATPYAVRDAVLCEVFETTGLRFDEQARFAEDVVFQFALYPQAGKVAAISDKLYRYRLDNPDSLCHTHQDDVKRLTSHVDVIERVFAAWQRLGLVQRYPVELLSWSRAYAFYGLEKLTDDERSSHLQQIGAVLRSQFDVAAVDALPPTVPVPERLLMRALVTEGATSAEIESRCKSHIWGLQFDAVPQEERRCAGFESKMLCRGDGKLYVKCRVRAKEPFSRIDSVAFADGVPVPVGIYPFQREAQGAVQEVVVEAPLVDASMLEVSIRPDGDVTQQATLSVSSRKARWLSRLNYRAHASQCAQIRDYERPFVFGRYRIQVTHRFPKGDAVVWRLTVSWTGEEARMPALGCFDARGLPLDAQIRFMEFQAGAADDSLGVNVAYYSVELPQECGYFGICAQDFNDAASGGERVEGGFAMVDGGLSDKLAQETRDLMKSAADDDGEYRAWFEERRAKDAALIAQRNVGLQHAARLSVLVEWDGRSEPALRRTLDSLAEQSLAGWWEVLVLVNAAADGKAAPKALSARAHHALAGFGQDRARWQVVEGEELDLAVLHLQGDYVAFTRAGDVLEPDALYEYARALDASSGSASAADVLYCDEDVIDDAGAYGQPFFKSRLNVDLLYCGNWVGSFPAFRRTVLEAAGSLTAGPGSDWRFEAALRAYEQGRAFKYVPRVLCHAPSCPLFASDASSLEGRRRILQRHLDRRGIPAQVENADVPGALRVSYMLPDDPPLVSIIIPSKDHIDLLDACLRSIVACSTYGAYEVIVVENNSVEPQTFQYYERICDELPCVRVIRWEHEFNYSKIINFGAEHARGDYYLFLNNDTEVAEPAFIEEMVGCLQRPEVGVVGAKLLFRDGLLQNAGSGVGVWDAVVCYNQNRAAGDGGYLQKACLPGDFTAVGGACQMTRASTFRQLGGYDEQLGVAFNDIDYCMRALDEGLFAVYTPYAAVFHYEFASRGREEFDAQKLERWQRERGLFMQKHPEPFAEGDLFTSPNLLRHNTYYRLQW